jgi:putative hemolysin
MLTDVLILFGLFILNGFFSMSETAIVSSRKSKLETEAQNGKINYQVALELANSPTKFLSTVQIGITLIGIITGAFSGASLSKPLAAWLNQFPYLKNSSGDIAFVLVILFTTFFSLVLGELLPKRLALHNPEKISALVSKLMRFLSKLAAPFIWILTISTETIFKLFPAKPDPESAPTEEEIRSMLKYAAEEGKVEQTEHDILERVFFLGDRHLASIMTNKMDLVCLDLNDNFENHKIIISQSAHSNFPVYEVSRDNIVGILNIKKLFPLIIQGAKVDIKTLLVPPLFVPETMNAFKLLEKLKESHTHIAIVLNQYGGMEGAVTIDDLFKALVGNLYNQEENRIIKREDGSWLADGLVPFDEFMKYFEIKRTPELGRHNFHTLGGFVMYVANRIPKAGDRFAWKNLRLEVLDMDGMRVDKVLIKKK